MGWNHQLMILLFSTWDPYALFVQILPQTWSHRWLQGTSGSRSQGMGNWQDTSCLYLYCLGIGIGKLSKKAPPVWWLKKYVFKDNMLISGPLIETWVLCFVRNCFIDTYMKLYLQVLIWIYLLHSGLVTVRLRGRSCIFNQCCLEVVQWYIYIYMLLWFHVYSNRMKLSI